MSFITERYEKYKTEGQEVSVTHSEVEELHKELEFLKQSLNVLQNILKSLTEKLAKMRSNDEMDDKKSDSIDIWLLMRTRLKESLEIITKDLVTDWSVKEPKDIVDYITTHFNEKNMEINSFQNPNEWLNQVLDELSLSTGNKQQVLVDFNQRFCLKLEDIHKNLIKLLKECVRIQDFYEVNVKEEMSWRSDLNALINHLQALNNSSKAIEINSMKTETNELSAKMSSIEEYSQLFHKFQNQEFDELQALLEALKQRIQMLSDTNLAIRSGPSNSLPNKT